MTQSGWRKILHQIFIGGWDRFITYSCFIGYGSWSLVAPRGSTGDAFPTFWGNLFNIEIVLAGVLLMISLALDSFWMRWLGFSIFFLGMVTIAAIIAVGSGSAVSLLVFGLAMQGFISLRNVSKAREANIELVKLARDLEKKADGGG